MLAFVASYALAFSLMAAGASGWMVQAGAVAGPTIAAATALRMEGNSLTSFFKDLFRNGISDWRLFALIPIMLALSFVAARLSGIELSVLMETYAEPGTYGLWAFNILVIALFEEIGWRGYLTRRLLARMSPFTTSLLVGAIWGLWHGPKLFSAPALALVALALSFVMTFLVATKRTGFIACILLHGSFNASVMALEPYAEFEAALATFHAMAAGMAIVAVAIVVARRDWFFARSR